MGLPAPDQSGRRHVHGGAARIRPRAASHRPGCGCDEPDIRGELEGGDLHLCRRGCWISGASNAESFYAGAVARFPDADEWKTHRATGVGESPEEISGAAGIVGSQIEE